MSKMRREDFVAGGEHRLVITDIDARGRGVVELEDGRLFVPGALPDERVEVRVRAGADEEGSELVADLVEVLEASDDRRDPLCEFDEVCRGCQLRHLTVGAELKYKTRLVARAVDEYGDIPRDDQPDIEVVTPQPIARGDAFRIRTRLQYNRTDDGVELGLESPVRDRLVPMHECPALNEPARRLVDTIRRTLKGRDRRLPALDEIRVVSPTHGVGLVDIRLAEIEDREQLEARILEEPIGSWLEHLAEELPDKVGVAISSGEYREEVVEPSRIRIPVGRWNMLVGWDDWFHSTLEPAARVYETMLEWLDLDETDRVLDIGCATGTITLMTSEHADEVVGVDINPGSIETAEINAVNYGRENVRFVVAGWQKALRELAMDEEEFTVATIHPTDEALGRRALAFLNVLNVRRLVYLGPSPTEASRDIRDLGRQGWTLTDLGTGNLHPATSRTLLMAGMRR